MCVLLLSSSLLISYAQSEGAAKSEKNAFTLEVPAELNKEFFVPFNNVPDLTSIHDFGYVRPAS
jgi:hypothetical protein